jgi:hypothetical protein
MTDHPEFSQESPAIKYIVEQVITKSLMGIDWMKDRPIWCLGKEITLIRDGVVKK